MLPPRDYPEFKPNDAVRKNPQDNESITVSSVLDRSESDQPVTDAMIRTAVSNLYSAQPERSLYLSNADSRRSHPRVPKALRSILKNVLRD